MSSEDVDCTKKINIDSNETQKCVKPCSGLMLATFTKSHEVPNLKHLIPVEINAYNKYKTITPYPRGFNGKMHKEDWKRVLFIISDFFVFI